MAIDRKIRTAPVSKRLIPFTPPGYVRVAPIRALGPLIRSLGGNPAAVFRAANINERELAKSDGVLPVAIRGKLLARAAQETGCEHFGLLLGARSGIRELGAAEQPLLKLSRIGLALEAFAAFSLLHNPAGVVFVGKSGDLATLGYAVVDGNIPGMPQLQDAAMAIALNIMRDMLGADWRPTGVNLMRHEPGDPALYAHFFGANCCFNAMRSELVFPATTLDFRLKNADAKGADRVQHHLDGPNWSSYVRRLIYRLLLQGECSQKQVAAALGISNRTLVRKLANCETSYQQLLETAQFSMSRTWIRETNRTMSEITAALGYNEASSFTRAFRRWSGMSPSQWRKFKTGPVSLPASKK
jgi:AraC-like DNA-binding protein